MHDNSSVVAGEAVGGHLWLLAQYNHVKVTASFGWAYFLGEDNMNTYVYHAAH